MMKSFLKRVVIAGLILFIFLFFIFVFIDSSGLSDHAYKKVLSKETGSLIVGTSRAAQALQPEIINPLIAQMGYMPTFNFSFTIIDSPFGEIYYKAISKKVNWDAEPPSKRLFIICVDPFSLCDIQEMDKKGIREREGILYGLPFYSKPNFFYLARNLKPWKWLKERKYMALHDDGWLELRINMDNSAFLERNKNEKIALYKNYIATPSQNRKDWLIKTIELFMKAGDVCLCRLSSCHEMNEIEDRIWPEFDNEMMRIADGYDIEYHSFYEDYHQFRTIDGNHICAEDGKLISRALCDSIALFRASKIATISKYD